MHKEYCAGWYELAFQGFMLDSDYYKADGLTVNQDANEYNAYREIADILGNQLCSKLDVFE